MSNELQKKIIDDLQKTGFPLEVLIATELENNKWIVYNSSLYRDDETPKSRELDIHAVNVDFSFANRIHRKMREGNENKLISHLIIQCKKTDKPWVFFNNGSISWPQIPMVNFKCQKEEFHGMLFDDLKKFGFKKHRYQNAKLHKSYHESFNDSKNSSRIYESLITVNKALRYFKKTYGIGGYSLHLFVPIVVIEGTLWSASVKKNNNLSLKSVDRIFVVFNQLSLPDKKNTSYEEEQIVEVITRKSFSKYLTEITKDNKELYMTWTNFINRSLRLKQSK